MDYVIMDGDLMGLKPINNIDMFEQSRLTWTETAPASSRSLILKIQIYFANSIFPELSLTYPKKIAG